MELNAYNVRLLDKVYFGMRTLILKHVTCVIFDNVSSYTNNCFKEIVVFGIFLVIAILIMQINTAIQKSLAT